MSYLAPRSLAVLLGSFDPPHRGHEWLVARLLEHAEAVLLLLPARHVHKQVLPGLNAPLHERLAMLALLEGREPRLRSRLSDESLFLRLDAALARVLPGTAISFAMGDETFDRLRDSERYFRAAHLAWGPAEARHLERLLPRTLVFGRHGAASGLTVPAEIAAISSTRVRRAAARLEREHAPEARWDRELGSLLAPDVLQHVHDLRPYRVAPVDDPR
jgi:cytidyltransferase-like protein